LSNRTRNSQPIQFTSGESVHSQSNQEKDPGSPASDIDPNLIFDPEERNLYILKQKMKKAQKPGRVYTQLKKIPQLGPGDTVDVEMRKMYDLSEVVQVIKSDLPNTNPRLRKQTYRSVLSMKRRNQEIAEEHNPFGAKDKEKEGVFAKPRINQILDKEE
jgi:hypothetical protein